MSLMFPLFPSSTETRFTKNWKMSNGHKLNQVGKERQYRHTHGEEQSDLDRKDGQERKVRRVICKPAPYNRSSRNICYSINDERNLSHLRIKHLTNKMLAI